MSRIIFLALQACGLALIATALALMFHNAWDPGCFYGALYVLACGVLLGSIVPAVITFKRPMMFLAIGCILVEVAASFWLLGFFNMRFVTPQRQALTVNNPERFVADARSLMTDVKEREEKRPGELPVSLQLPHLRYAKVFPDHVDLVIQRDPDDEEGFRVWSATSHRVHRDRPTRYRDVFTYHYNNDIAESPHNIE